VISLSRILLESGLWRRAIDLFFLQKIKKNKSIALQRGLLEITKFMLRAVLKINLNLLKKLTPTCFKPKKGAS
jgi:hypothetical protein